MSKKTKVPARLPEDALPTARTSRTFFEILFDYNISDDPVNNYTVETYFFIPKTLRVNPGSYTTDDFYADLENYIRFKTPRIALSGLVDPGNEYSPLARVKAPLREILNGNLDEELPERVTYELKILGNLIRSNTRDEVGNLVQLFAADEGNWSSCVAHAETFLGNVDKFREMFGDLEERVYLSQIPPTVRETYDIVRDYASYVVEKYLTRLYLGIQKYQSKIDCQGLMERIRAIVASEQEVRKRRNSKLAFRERKENEGFTYWLSLYKKFVSSVLFMEINEKNERFQWSNLFYAFAAGIAMAFYVWLSFFAQNLQLSTITLLGLLVILYVVKDRIKELIRISSDRVFVRYFPDRKFKIIDSATGQTIGACRETVKFVEKAPFEVQSLRDVGARTDLERTMKPENILFYKKRITLFANKILETHSRQRNVHDIMRFSIQRFLTFADKAYTSHEVLDGGTGKVKDVVSAKVYHLSVIQKMTASSEKTRNATVIHRYRVIIDKNGVKRVEKVVI
ncbi:MAG: hypothetical protein ACTSU5_09225 [Promethearchaeota archaeon]